MHVVAVYNTDNPDAKHNIQSLLLALDGPIDIYLPNGRQVEGILKEVNGTESDNIIKLTVEIDDVHETLYYIHHRQDEINCIRRN